MELNINSPAYYTEKYGVNDSVYALCKKIRKFVSDKKYSDKVGIIGICPVAAPEDELNKGKWKEHIKYDLKYSLIVIWKHIDYDLFVSSDDNGKCELMLKCILDSVKKVSRKGKIDFAGFQADVLNYLGTPITEKQQNDKL